MMKKVISIAAIGAGVLTLLSVVAPMVSGLILEAQAASSVGIIGGADGPTVIMITRTIGAGSVMIEIVIGILLIVGGICGLRKSKK